MKKDSEREKNKVAQKVYENIKKQGIEIKPRCHILACKLFWVFLAFLVFLLSLFVAILAVNYLVDFKPFSVLGQNLFFLPAFYPFLILFAAALLIYIASRFYRRSRTRCKHEEWMLLGALFLLSLIFLFLTALFGVDKKIFYATEGSLKNNNFILSRYDYWSLPGDGTLSGLVISEDSPAQVYTIKDWKGNKWSVVVEDCSAREKKLFEIQDKLKMIGKQGEKHNFNASSAWAWNY
ncbi:MAG: hypothetical protein ACOCUF_00715 [Patescibacteria group bacterium]